LRNKPFILTLVIVLLCAVIFTSCSLPTKKSPAATASPAAQVETAAASTKAALIVEVTSTPIASPTSEPTAVPTSTPTPENTATPLPSPTNTPPSVSLPKKSSITGETLPTEAPVDSWNSIPIAPGAITGQQKKNELGERYYIFTIQSNATTMQDYYLQALAQADWTAIEGGMGDNRGYAIFTKKDKFLRLEFIIEEGDQNLILVRIFKWDDPFW
jgi:hypothetical protein